jgi:2-oxo-4-hydroxy-4-carboxy--5-ureidoimidazoline (OHCU) decarboxylase
MDAEQQTQLRNAENYLDLAEKILTNEPEADKTKKLQASIQTQRLQQDVYINQGILLWAKAGLEAPNQTAKEEWLDQAEDRFKQAADLEYNLPTVAMGRRADCYEKIALYINAKIKTKRHQVLKTDPKQAQQAAENCSDTISSQPNHDLYDVFLMSRAMKAKLGMAASKEPEK